MQIKNKFNNFVARLSEKSFKINVFIFALLWIIYIVANYFFYFFIIGDSLHSAWFYICVVCGQIFYIFLGLAVLVGLTIRCIRTEGLSITLYPNIFIRLILFPQVAVFLLFILLGVVAYFVDVLKSIAAHPAVAVIATVGFLIVFVCALIAMVFLAVIYAVGLIIFIKKIFKSDINLPVPSSKKIKNQILFWMILIPSFVAVIFSHMLTGGLRNYIGDYFNDILCDEENETSVCAWMSRQCWVKLESFTKDYCYFREAEEKHDQSICEKIKSDPYAKKKCLSRTIEN